MGAAQPMMKSFWSVTARTPRKVADRGPQIHPGTLFPGSLCHKVQARGGVSIRPRRECPRHWGPRSGCRARWGPPSTPLPAFGGTRKSHGPRGRPSALSSRYIRPGWGLRQMRLGAAIPCNPLCPACTPARSPIARLKQPPCGLNAPALPAGGQGLVTWFRGAAPRRSAPRSPAMARAYSQGSQWLALAHVAPLHLRRKVRLSVRVSLCPAARRAPHSPCRFSNSLQVAQLVRERKHQGCRSLRAHQLRAEFFSPWRCPRTFSCAIRVPGSGSYPACRMALLAWWSPWHIVFRLQNQHRRLPPGQVVCGGRANHAAADDRNIYHLFLSASLSSFPSGLQRKAQPHRVVVAVCKVGVQVLGRGLQPFAETMNPSSTVV